MFSWRLECVDADVQDQEEQLRAKHPLAPSPLPPSTHPEVMLTFAFASMRAWMTGKLPGSSGFASGSGSWHSRCSAVKPPLQVGKVCQKRPKCNSDAIKTKYLLFLGQRVVAFTSAFAAKRIRMTSCNCFSLCRRKEVVPRFLCLLDLYKRKYRMATCSGVSANTLL